VKWWSTYYCICLKMLQFLTDDGFSHWQFFGYVVQISSDNGFWKHFFSQLLLPYFKSPQIYTCPVRFTSFFFCLTLHIDLPKIIGASIIIFIVHQTNIETTKFFEVKKHCSLIMGRVGIVAQFLIWLIINVLKISVSPTL